ncbi:TetR/AcrR family transcriptional regulator [Glutamicibacter protophormiae]|uniref:TetR/AcrR family transcriptional regulator n=1 Tax=Glutamicibacter protophormiae TaxID=37930 RepID=UPI002A7F8848|nr:TetR/AcrR family transcriptional regulator [Glutamicibacter protophormiae]WPR63128.1 TetR/AcrR family transcriptional regulator [Glutamicibacter protophormiae]WPR66624.1 TetR/AcrR family transcriptional regulator [Glutamicibacter protophormiae]
MASQKDYRSAPRRRGEQLVTAILDAAAMELAESGFSALSFEAVARRAGASKVSIYRRWPNKIELVRAVAAHKAVLPDLPEQAATLREDLLLVLRSMAEQIGEPIGEMLRGLVIASLAEQAPSMADMSWGMGPNMMQRVAERAQARGELAAIPAELVLRVPIELFKQRFISFGKVTDRFIVELVDQIAIPLWTLQTGEPHAS